mgnify:CR=1 FL=1
MFKKFVSLSFLLSSFLLLAAPSRAATNCALAKIEADQGGQNWNVTYCVTADTPGQLQAVSSVTATCRESPHSGDAVDLNALAGYQNCSCYYDQNMSPSVRPDLYSVCNAADGNIATPPAPAASSSQGVVISEVTQDQSGKYLTCFTLTHLDRNMGKIETVFKDQSGKVLCSPPPTEVSPVNYGLFEYYQNTIATRTGLIPTFAPGGGPGDAFCTQVNIKEGINTAFGCISTDPTQFISNILSLAVGIGGSLGLILLLYGFFILTTSSGIPEKIQSANDIISSAIIGLVLIVLAVVLTRFIGITLFALPGLQ